MNNVANKPTEMVIKKLKVIDFIFGEQFNCTDESVDKFYLFNDKYK